MQVNIKVIITEREMKKYVTFDASGFGLKLDEQRHRQ